MSEPFAELFPGEFSRASPLLKITWAALYFAMHDRCTNLTLMQPRWRAPLIMMMDDRQLVPPPVCDFRRILKAFRRVARSRRAEKNGLTWRYTEVSGMRKLEIRFDYSRGDPAAYVNDVYCIAVRSDQEKMERAKAESQRVFLKVIAIWVFFLLWLGAFVAGVVLSLP